MRFSTSLRVYASQVSPMRGLRRFKLSFAPERTGLAQGFATSVLAIRRAAISKIES